MRIAHVHKTAGFSWLRMWVTRRRARSGEPAAAACSSLHGRRVAKILPCSVEIQNLVLVDRAMEGFPQRRYLRDVLLLHGFQGMEDRLYGRADDHSRTFPRACLALTTSAAVNGRPRHPRTALAHPFSL